MSTGGWVAGGLRRAVTGVMSVLPGHGTPDADAESGSDTHTDSEAAVATPAPAAPVAMASAAPSRATESRRSAAPKVASTRAPKPAAPTATATVEPAPSPPVVSPWTTEELTGFRVALEADIVRLREELNMGEADMAELIADTGDGAGDDQADAGSKTLEREQEMSVTANARELLDQSTHAMVRLQAGTYGVCEGCASAIPAPRLRAFPRATLCIACKQAEERR
ncbi:MAG: TraR/DksA family transcriptional regulator [Actinomycetota bacterium]|nr:TraR/DksA family transcriptional regulator [Actinomycetota bacterium]